MQILVVTVIVLALCVIGAVVVMGLALNRSEQRAMAKLKFKKAKQALKNEEDLYPKASDVDKLYKLRDNGWNVKAYRRYPGGTVRFNSGTFYKDNRKDTLITLSESNDLKENEENND